MRIRLIFFFFFTSSINNFSIAQWSDVHFGVNKAVQSLHVDSLTDLLFVGGQFDTAGGININNIATWDGTSWNQFGNNNKFSFPGAVTSIVKFNGSIIVAGDFDSIGSTLVNNIARWNGLTWESLGNGFDNTVEDIIVYNSDLYACGQFSFSGTDYVECFAKWNGSNWERISQLIGEAYSFSIYKNKLIIAGSFFHQSISSFGGICGWDGIELDTTLGYFNYTVLRLRTILDTLYAVGSFTSIPSNPSNYISLYYNQNWHTIGSPVGGSNWVLDVRNYFNSIYFCGYFTNPPDLCIYNGVGFDSVVSISGFLKIMTEYKGKLIVGGTFSAVNGSNIFNIAQFNYLDNSIIKESRNNKILEIYPNPSLDGHFIVKNNLLLDKNNKMIINIYSVQGKLVLNEEISNYFQDNEISIPPISGIYFIKCELNGSLILCRKIVIQ